MKVLNSRTERSTSWLKPLNAEEIAELRESPFVSSVISGRITFTPEFKHMAYQQLGKGKSMREIFEENGIDPEILGNARMIAGMDEYKR